MLFGDVIARELRVHQLYRCDSVHRDGIDSDAAWAAFANHEDLYVLPNSSKWNTEIAGFEHNTGKPFRRAAYGLDLHKRNDATREFAAWKIVIQNHVRTDVGVRSALIVHLHRTCEHAADVVDDGADLYVALFGDA